MTSEKPILYVDCDTSHICRPSLKRQTTAPMPSNGRPKRQRGEEQVDFITPNAIHAAFLTELQSRSRSQLPQSPYPFESRVSTSPKNIYFRERPAASSPQSLESSFDVPDSRLSDYNNYVTRISHSPPHDEASESSIDNSSVQDERVQPGLSIAILSEMTISSPNDKLNMSSIAQRRHARAGDAIPFDFRVQMPRTEDLQHLRSGLDRGDTPLSPTRLFEMGFRPPTSTNLITPAHQCGVTTPVVPKAPKLINFRRNSFAKSRWLPTPTEGVLPTVVLDSITPPSPTISPTVSQILSETARPSLVNRSLSWLSFRPLPSMDTQRSDIIESGGRFKYSDRNSLESPFESA